MSEVFRYRDGATPLLVSIPHDGREIPAALRSRMTKAGLDMPDTDWHVAKLYEFAEASGASVIVANYSRYVVDLNRPATDDPLYEGQVSTGLCPSKTFAGDPIYSDGDVSELEMRERVGKYWQPYHDRIAQTLAQLRAQHGYALLWDAHSIPSRVPRLFQGELPHLNIGSNDGRSCAQDIGAAVTAIARTSDFDTVLNARFKGGYITRHYGRPLDECHALQLEIAQRAYMDECTRRFDESGAAILCRTLKRMLQAFLDAAKRR